MAFPNLKRQIIGQQAPQSDDPLPPARVGTCDSDYSDRYVDYFNLRKIPCSFESLSISTYSESESGIIIAAVAHTSSELIPATIHRI